MNLTFPYFPLMLDRRIHLKFNTVNIESRGKKETSIGQSWGFWTGQ